MTREAAATTEPPCRAAKSFQRVFATVLRSRSRRIALGENAHRKPSRSKLNGGSKLVLTPHSPDMLRTRISKSQPTVTGVPRQHARRWSGDKAASGTALIVTSNVMDRTAPWVVNGAEQGGRQQHKTAPVAG